MSLKKKFNPYLPTAYVKFICVHCGKKTDVAVQTKSSKYGIYFKKYSKKGIPSFVPKRVI